MKNLLLLAIVSCTFAGTTFAQFQITHTDQTCFGSCDGSATIMPSGNFQYLWSNAYIGQTMPNLCAGTYICTVTDQIGNPLDTLSATISQPTQMTVSVVSSGPTTCGWCNGYLDVTVSGGTAPYAYMWSNGSTTEDLNGACAGTYSATIVDANGCTVSVYETVTDNSNFSVSVTTSGEIFCSSVTSTTIEIIGGNPPYNISWGNGFAFSSNNTTHTHAFTSPGVYYIDISDQDSCYAFVIDTVGLTLPYTYTITKSDQNCAQLGTADVDVTGGALPITYEWSTLPAEYTDSVGGLFAGIYYVTISDNTAGCIVVESVNIANLNPINGVVTSTKELCDFNNGTATIVPQTGTPPYTYIWNTNPVQTTATAINLSQGTYSVTFTDANLCSGQRSVTVGYTSPVQPNPVAVNEVCGNGQGSITLTPLLGTPPYTYQWSGGGTSNTLANLSDGYYSFTVDDAQSCSVTGTAYVQDVPPFNVNITTVPQTCLAFGSATANVTGSTGPYTYRWNTPTAQTTVTATGLTAGYYNCTVTDVNGCISVRSVNVQYDPLVQGTFIQTSALCLSPSGSINLTPGGGLPPYTFLWSNGAITEDITNVPTGYYSVTITDANNCRIVKTKKVETYSNLQLTVTSVNASCIFTNDGQATAIPSNGTPPYTYRWGNGAVTQTVTGLNAGWSFGVIVTDANGCTATRCSNPIGYNDLSCAVQMSGKVLNDFDRDCTFSAGDEGFNNVPVYCVPGYMDLTDVGGNYNFIVQPGNYALNHIPPYHAFQLCPEGSVELFGMLPGADTIVNFYDTMRAALDLSVNFGCIQQPRPGFTHDVTLTCRNKGNVLANAIVEYDYDTILNFVSTTHSGTFTHDVANRKLIFNLDNFNQGAVRTFRIAFQTPPTTALGTQVKDCVTIFPIVNDVHFIDNSICDSNIVVGSFDPNDKVVSPQGEKIPGFTGFYITRDDSVLHYKIRFQNTGTYFAQNVAILDTLDEDLDITTIDGIIASHDFRVDFYMNKYLAFYFDNIYLPDSFTNERESHGYVSFFIKQKPLLPNGTQISNRAAIYFDYNEPIITNTVTVIIAAPDETGINPREYGKPLAYPNPAQDMISFVLEHANDNILKVELYDLSGKLCKESRAAQLELSSLAKGMYLFRVQTVSGKMYAGKVLKE